MAGAKDLKKKIRSISNTKKITRTMELVATAKSKRAQQRLVASTPYSVSLTEILRNLAAAGTVDHPLLKEPSGDGPTVVFVVSANRGLCGGYNTNVVALAERTIREEETAGRKVEVQMAGRKGAARFRFLKIPMAKNFLELDDKATFADTLKASEPLLARFLAGEVKRVLVVYTHFHSAGVQRPEVAQLLPIQPPRAEEEGIGTGNGTGNGTGTGTEGKKNGTGKKAITTEIQYIFEPDPKTILESLLPLSVKSAFFRIVAEAATSEQIARRLAMKMATDNAEEMIRKYTRIYNRSRQAGITQQINEIVSGANALD